MTKIPIKEDTYVTTSVVFLTIVYGTMSSVLGIYVVRFLDRMHKNNRHG